MAGKEGQQHPIGVYLKIWALLFIFSTFSYLVDYFHIQGYLRWFLILLFMVLKAGLIISVFMHMFWERMSLICAILVPPLCLLVLVGLMTQEAGYTEDSRIVYYGENPNLEPNHPPSHQEAAEEAEPASSQQ